MSEQQKDGSTTGTAGTGAIAPVVGPTTEQNTVDAGEATIKPKRRSAAKAKAPPEAADEPAKPKRSSSSKAKNVLTKVSASADVQPAESPGQGGSPSTQPDNLPPLPPAPVPTPEGIAFMQQHIAYQTALDQRAELQRARSARATQVSKESQAPVVTEPDRSDTQFSGTTVQTKAPVRAGSAKGDETAVNPSIAESRNSSKENLIEAGPNVRKGPISKDDLQAVHDAEDVRLMRVLLDKPDDDTARLTAVPESVRKRFLKVDSDYYFPDRSPAFVDRGARLATRGEHPEVVKALVEIAKERGWNTITVKGSEAFRRAAWMEAVRNGMQVAGYKPTELDLAQSEQREPTNLIETSALKEQGSTHAPSRTKPIDHALSEKLSAFANDRPTLVVKRYPDLVQAYALLDAARKFAEAHMPGHESQFVAIGKQLITQQLREGKEVIGPKVHPDHISQSRSGRTKPDVAVERSPQPQDLVRER
jgi:hypothetical protein